MKITQRLGMAASILTRGAGALQSWAGWVTMAGGMGRPSRFNSPTQCQQAMVLSEYWAMGLTAIAEAVSSAQPRIQVAHSKEVVSDANHPAVKLLANPNCLENYQEFIERSVYYLFNTGEVFWFPTKSSLAGTPMALQCLRPERMSFDPDAEVGVKQWRYQGPTKELPIQPDQVIFTKFTDPAQDIRGLSRARVLARSLEAEIEIYDWVAKFFRNGAHMGGFLQSPNARNPDLEQVIKAQWDDTYSGTQNAHKTAILWAGLEYKERTTNGPKEADFGGTSKQIRERVLGFLKVPPIKVGIVENANRSNSDMQERSFQLDAVSPVLRRLAPSLTEVVQRIDPRLEVVFPKAVMRDDDTQSQIAQRYFQMGALSPNKVREDYLGEEAVDEPGMDDYYLPLGMVSVNMADEGGQADPAAGNQGGQVVAPAVGQGGAAAGRATFRPMRKVGAGQAD